METSPERSKLGGALLLCGLLAGSPARANGVKTAGDVLQFLPALTGLA